jgi:MFS family permease
MSTRGQWKEMALILGPAFGATPGITIVAKRIQSDPQLESPWWTAAIVFAGVIVAIAGGYLVYVLVNLLMGRKLAQGLKNREAARLVSLVFLSLLFFIPGFLLMERMLAGGPPYAWWKAFGFLLMLLISPTAAVLVLDWLAGLLFKSERVRIAAVQARAKVARANAPLMKALAIRRRIQNKRPRLAMVLATSVAGLVLGTAMLAFAHTVPDVPQAEGPASNRESLYIFGTLFCASGALHLINVGRILRKGSWAQHWDKKLAKADARIQELEAAGYRAPDSVMH